VADPMRLYSVAPDSSGLDLLIGAITKVNDSLWWGVIERVDSLGVVEAHFNTVGDKWTERLLV
jgi:hypothetical protein